MAVEPAAFTSARPRRNNIGDGKSKHKARIMAGTGFFRGGSAVAERATPEMLPIANRGWGDQNLPSETELQDFEEFSFVE